MGGDQGSDEPLRVENAQGRRRPDRVNCSCPCISCHRAPLLPYPVFVRRSAQSALNRNVFNYQKNGGFGANRQGKTKTDVPKEANYLTRQITGEREPPTSLGGIFEINTMVFLDSLVVELMHRLGRTEADSRRTHSTVERANRHVTQLFTGIYQCFSKPVT
jgi:hypothetical protein